MKSRTIWAGSLMAALAAGLIGTDAGLAQELRQPDTVLARASHVVVPQSRGFSLSRSRQRLVIESVKANIQILGQAATTVLEVSLRNNERQQAEAVLLLPVPDGGVVSGFDFLGGSAEPTATLLPRDEARRIYSDIVRRARDPALLEFAGFNLIRSSVFPVPAGGTQTVRLRYEQVLEADGKRIDYVLPRSESLDETVPWTISASVKSKLDVSTVFSPSHELGTARVNDKHVRVELSGAASSEPGAFRLSYLSGEGDDVTASFFTYPDPKIGGGYFLMIAGLPPHLDEAKTAIKREVTVVIDRSGSMAGKKMDQVRAAALQVIEGLADGEAFNIIDYGTTVEMLSANPLVKNRETTLKARKYLDSLTTSGGTNIHDALVEALRQEPTPKALPLVLFLTDGLPTVGRTSEVSIRELVEKGNPHARRVFTFGVGTDVNAPLLDRVAELSRGAVTYVLPDEDVELKVARVFKRLYGPVLADPRVGPSAAKSANPPPLRELIPNVVPDLFDGDQLVMLGQYRGNDRIGVDLSGNYLGKPRRFKFVFDPKNATTRNAFVPRLWASRRIAYLVDQIRQAGAPEPGRARTAANIVLEDPKFRELTDEIVRLSSEFGILSEYTAFLATEGTDLGNWADLVKGCGLNLDRRAVRGRSGAEGVNQAINNDWGKKQTVENRKNGYMDHNLNRVEITGVKQVCDRAFFKRGTSWIDSNLVGGDANETPEHVVEFGSPEHLKIIAALVKQGRQALIALEGDIVLEYEGKTIIIRNPSDD